MWSEEIFLRVGALFVECTGALMQILVSLDRDKNSYADTLVVRERDLRSDFVLPWRLPIEPASEKRLTVGLCFVKKTTNRAFEWGETYGRTLFLFFCLSRRLPIGLANERRIVLFSFYYFDDQLDLSVKETDRLYCCVRNLHLWQEGSKPWKKKIFFASIMTLFKLVLHKFPNKTILHLCLCSFQITHEVKQCAMCLHTTYLNTTNLSMYLPWLELLQSCDIHAAHTTKILQNFGLNLVITWYLWWDFLWNFYSTL